MGQFQMAVSIDQARHDDASGILDDRRAADGCELATGSDGDNLSIIDRYRPPFDGRARDGT